MTARVVIEQIKALPPEEQAKVIDFLREVKAAQEVFERHAQLMQKLSRSANQSSSRSGRSRASIRSP